MTELTYEVPTVGEKHQASDQRVSTALTEIKSVLNGRLTANNFAKETITPKKFVRPAKWIFQKALLPAILAGNSLPIAAGGLNDIMLVTAHIEGTSEVDFSVSGTKLARGIREGGAISIGPVRVPAGEQIEIECISGKVTSVDLASYAES